MDGPTPAPEDSIARSGADLARLLPLAVLAVSVTALGTAYIAQFGFGLEPCPLCLYQRIPFWAAIGLAIAALVLGRPLNVGFLGLAGVAFLAGAVIAGYHVGVEQHWWVSATCGGQLPGAMSGDQLLSALTSKPEKGCDEIDWTFLGVSMASWNALASPLIGGAVIWAALRLRSQQGTTP